MVFSMEMLSLLLNVSSKLIKTLVDMPEDDASWRNIKLGDLMIEEDYEAVKERIRREREGG